MHFQKIGDFLKKFEIEGKKKKKALQKTMLNDDRGDFCRDWAMAYTPP
ncbi:MAG: hypothetical protein CM15mP54_15570 [Paracoccaceae bacterium]|nr:MAG: hypothetical protein CM15mP54_15570 [Paracoccaceae bacterium]